ncbi:MAG: hypothetical protein ACQCXQ_13455 [Verrucomicrobiales bacterium]
MDDGVVQHLLAGPMSERNGPIPADLALAADGDFAGFCLAGSLANPREEKTPERRPTPPSLEEIGIGSPYRGTHRWWLAGITGLLTTLLFSFLLINLALREQENTSSSIPQPRSEATPSPDQTRPISGEPTPVLTDITPLK